jgi:polysaccharide export outer membrane protein
MHLTYLLRRFVGSFRLPAATGCATHHATHGATVGPRRLLALLALTVALTPAVRAAGDAAVADRLGPGDTVVLSVFGQPDLSGPVTVGADGSLPLAFGNAVTVERLTTDEAARKIETALREQGILERPAVVVTVSRSRSQRVSVLGEVGAPGRYVLEPGATVLDLLADAGGLRDTAAAQAWVLRPRADGSTERLPVAIDAGRDGQGPAALPALRPGDAVVVPPAEQFYVYGQVNNPDSYPLRRDTTVIQAIAMAGGLTARGTDRSVEIRRLRPDGSYERRKGRAADRIAPGDVIRVRERLF